MEDADVFALVGMLGKASAYFPVSYTEEYYEKDSEQNYENEYSENMTYVLNTDKTLKRNISMALRTLIPMLQLIMIVIISKYGLYSLLIKRI